jgi:hypothetical protein
MACCTADVNTVNMPSLSQQDGVTGWPLCLTSRKNHMRSGVMLLPPHSCHRLLSAGDKLSDDHKVMADLRTLSVPAVQAPPQKPVVLVVSGPSGVGKDAIVNHLRSMQPDLHFVVTATSRCAIMCTAHCALRINLLDFCCQCTLPAAALARGAHPMMIQA